MIIRRTLKAVATTAVLGLAIVGFAAPSHANTTVTVTGTYANSAWTGVNVSPSAVVGQTVTIDVGTTGRNELRFVSDLLYSDFGGETCGGKGCYVEGDEDPETFQILPSAANSTVEVKDASASEPRPTIGSFTITYSSPSNGSVETAVDPAPALVTLQVLDAMDDTWAPATERGLVGWEKTVPVNTWQPLPESADVVGIGEDEGKVFLGVATTTDFPVDVAQRQVDNGWGTYEMFDDEGDLESVFIPAGGSMFVWTQPRLYAVWGDPAS